MNPQDVADAFAAMLAEVRTTLPGEIVEWDGKRATVRPAIPKRLASGDVLAAPRIVSVPVLFPIGSGGAASISVPLKAGDHVLLHFCERALESWLSGSKDAPDDPRQFDLSDAFASPLVAPFAHQVETTDVVVKHGGGTFRLKPGGDCQYDGPTMTINAPTTINGTLHTTGAVTFDSTQQVQGAVTTGSTISAAATVSAAGFTGKTGGAASMPGAISSGDIVVVGKSFLGHTHPKNGEGGGQTLPPS